MTADYIDAMQCIRDVRRRTVDVLAEIAVLRTELADDYHSPKRVRRIQRKLAEALSFLECVESHVRRIEAQVPEPADPPEPEPPSDADDESGSNVLAFEVAAGRARARRRAERRDEP